MQRPVGSVDYVTRSEAFSAPAFPSLSVSQVVPGGRVCLNSGMKINKRGERSGPSSDPESFLPDLRLCPSSKSSLPNQQPPNLSTGPTMRQLLASMFAAACFSLLGMWSIGSAQVTPSPLPAQQPPVMISPVQPVGASAGSETSAKIITPSTTTRPAPKFRSAGRGLPGMPGGPPLTSPLGARDSRPTTVGPLFCDPVVDFPC